MKRRIRFADLLAIGAGLLLAACGGGGGGGSQPPLAPPSTLAVFAGAVTEAGNIDAQGPAARFDGPTAVAVDSISGALYVADSRNHTIRRIAPDGSVSTFAGMAGQAGFVDGPGAAARFRDPTGIALDRNGALYVADKGNFAIRRIDPTGTVTTLAGGQRGTADATGRSASFYFGSVAPAPLAVDRGSNVYVADGPSIRRITPAGAVTTIAGNPLQWQYIDGPATLARFGDIWSLAIDASGNVYAAEGRIRKLGHDGVVSTFLAIDDSSRRAHGLAIDSADHVFVADWGQNTLFRISPQGAIQHVAGTGSWGVQDGPIATATLNRPAIALAGGALVMAESQENVVRRLDLAAGNITTIAGTPAMFLHDLPADGIGAAARFGFITDLEAGPGGTLHVADRRLRRIGPVGNVDTLADALRVTELGVSASGIAYVPVTEYCGDAATRTTWPCGMKVHAIAPDGSATILRDFGNAPLVADAFAQRDGEFYMAIREYLGSSYVLRFRATGPTSRIWPDTASGIAVEGGAVYLSDSVNHVVRRIGADGTQAVVAGRVGERGAADGPALAATFDRPAGIAIDPAGGLYVADSGNHLVRKIAADGTVSTVAGTLGARGFAGGSAPGILDDPHDVAIVGTDLYIAMRTAVVVLRNRP